MTTKSWDSEAFRSAASDFGPLLKLGAALALVALFVVAARSAQPAPSTTTVVDVSQMEGRLRKQIDTRFNEIKDAVGQAGPAAQTGGDGAKAWAIFTEVQHYWFDKARYDEVVKKLDEAHALAPNNFEVSNLLGRAHANMKRHDLALPCFDAALEWNPKHLGALLGMASALMNLDRCDEAKPFVVRAQAIDADDEGVKARADRLTWCKQKSPK